MENREIERLKCDLCGKLSLVLIQVHIPGEFFDMRSKGICYNCFKEGQIDDKIFVKNQKYCEEMIKDCKEKTRIWESELKKIRNAKKRLS
jgi:hypothetical protein